MTMADRPPLVLREYDSIRLSADESCHWCAGAGPGGDIKLCRKCYDALAAGVDEWRGRQDGGKPPELMRFGHEHMQARNYCGALQARDGPALEILPKIDLGSSVDADKQTRTIFMRMLPAWLDGGKEPRRFDDVSVQRHGDMPLLEQLIALFLESVRGLVRRGLAHAYSPREGNLPFLRGRLDFGGQLRHNLVRKERFYVRYDEWTPDRPANRVMKCALERVRPLISNVDNYRIAHQLSPHFDGVSLPGDWRVEDDKVHLRREAADHYRMPLLWARTILERLNPASWRADTLAYSLLFPMEQVFEKFVAAHLRRHERRPDCARWLLCPPELQEVLQSGDWRIHTQSREVARVMEDASGGKLNFAMRPDIVAAPRTDGGHWIIMDTKWKRIGKEQDKHGISQADIYQMYSYGMRYCRDKGCPVELALLYPRSERFAEPQVLREPSGEKPLRLHLLPVDLAAACEAGG